MANVSTRAAVCVAKILLRKPHYSEMEAICEVAALFRIPWKQVEAEYSEWVKGEYGSYRECGV